MDGANWSALMQRVLRKLQDHLEAMPIRPDQQDLQPVRDVLAWKGVAPDDGLVQVLEKAFFPRWVHALRTWLDRKGDLPEILKWYEGWKQEFQVLAGDSRVQR